MVKRGEVYYIDSVYNTGSEQRAGRPAIIVSNNKNNQFSKTVEVVYLTSKPKADLPTHVSIRSIGSSSIALCEQVTTVAVERVKSYKGYLTDQEMDNIDIAIMISLGLEMDKIKDIANSPREAVQSMTKEAEEQIRKLKEELALEKAKSNAYELLYRSALTER